MPQSIFEIPELAQLIHAYLKPHDSAHLARSNRQLFFTIMPRLWERVEDQFQLIGLLPSLRNINYKQSRHSPVALPKPLVEADFSRFNIYGPWVKHLKNFKELAFSCEDLMLNALYPFAITHTLLPNLTSVSYASAPHIVNIFWVLPFLSSSLLSLELAMASHQNYHTIATPDLAILRHVLFKKCTNLETLLLPRPQEAAIKYPQDFLFLKNLKQDIGMEPGDAASSLGLVITSFPLVRLTITDEIFDHSGFETISTWPLLESLGIYLEPTKNYALPKLSGRAFPSLKHFALHDIPEYGTFRMFWDAPMLVGGLTSVKLWLADGFFREGGFAHLFLSILMVLAEQSPHIQGLWLRIATPYHHGGVALTYPVSISALGSLPRTLQALHLDGTCFSRRAGIAEPLSKMFPVIKKLRFPGHQMNLSDLKTFCAEMPCLEIFCIDLGLGDLARYYRYSFSLEVDLRNIPRHRHSPFHALEIDCSELTRTRGINPVQYADVVSFVQYLFSLWPNVQIAAQPWRGARDKAWQAHNRMVTLINGHLAELSRCNRDTSLKYEDVAVLNEDSWKQCMQLLST